MKTLAILGGGAAGLAAAVSALRTSEGRVRVVIAERLSRVGKKLLSTGNGRCNFTNTDISAGHYHGDTRFAERVLSRFGTEEAVRFFRSVGVPEYIEDGRVYPMSESAAGLLDALRAAASGAETATDFKAAELLPPKASGGMWRILSTDGAELTADAVIIATGGRAAPSLGSDGSGIELLRALGYEVTRLLPALVQLKVERPSVAALKGVRVRAEASAFSSGRLVHRERGEVLFTEYGLSGIPIFQITAHEECDTVTLDLCPKLGKGELLDELENRKEIFFTHTAEDFFAGMFQKRLGNLVLRAAGVEKLSRPVSSFDGGTLERIASALKRLEFRVSGRMGWENAQVTAGGVRAAQFDPETMESRLHPRLYAAGELLDVHGDCGGYNLHWAWATGVTAGCAAARALEAAEK